jgi:DNA-binding response OmpR family regulator
MASTKISIIHDDNKLTVGPITVDIARQEVEVSGRLVRLTNIEFKLLSFLMRRQGRVQERDRLLNEVWGYDGAIDTRTVDTHVRRLRKKLGKGAIAIETVRAVGYRIRER